MSQILISEEQLEKLPRKELVALVKLLLNEIEQLNWYRSNGKPLWLTIQESMSLLATESAGANLGLIAAAL